MDFPLCIKASKQSQVTDGEEEQRPIAESKSCVKKKPNPKALNIEGFKEEVGPTYFYVKRTWTFLVLLLASPSQPIKLFYPKQRAVNVNYFLFLSSKSGRCKRAHIPRAT